jgi:hypothetical protein
MKKRAEKFKTPQSATESQLCRSAELGVGNVKNTRVKDNGEGSINAAAQAEKSEGISSGGRANLKKTEARSEKKQNKLKKNLYLFDYVFTIISTIYAIASTVFFIANDWVNDTASYVLIALLAAYVIAFIVIMAVTFRKPVRGRVRPLKYYRSLLKIFRGAATLTFLVLSAVSMAAVASGGGFDIAKWAAFLLTFAVALIKLGFSVFKLVSRLYARSVGTRFKVEVVKYRNGENKKKGLLDKYTESRYKYGDDNDKLD